MSRYPIQQPFQLPALHENDRSVASISILELACQSMQPAQDGAPETEVLPPKDGSSSLILAYLTGKELGI